MALERAGLAHVLRNFQSRHIVPGANILPPGTFSALVADFGLAGLAAAHGALLVEYVVVAVAKFIEAACV